MTRDPYAGGGMFYSEERRPRAIRVTWTRVWLAIELLILAVVLGYDIGYAVWHR